MNISVFITSYNQKAYLHEAINSVLAQTLRPCQIVIVDDYSTDGSQALIEGYQSRYPDLITPIFHAQNQGVAQVRDTALRAVTGDYVTYLDGDDRYLPAKLQKESALLAARPDLQIAFSNFYIIDSEGQRIRPWISDKQPAQGDVYVETLTRRFPGHMLFRMELLPYALWQEVGFHDPELDLFEDWEMRIRLTRRYRVGYVDHSLAEYRLHSGGLSRASSAVKLHAFEHLWRKHEPLLADMEPQERSAITKEMNRLHAMFIRRQAKELLGAYGGAPRDEKGQAWDYYRDSLNYHRMLDWDLLAGLALPSPIYLPLRNGIRQATGRGYDY